MPIPYQERGRRGGLARAAALTPAERKASASRAHLAGAVNAIVNRAPELAPEQVERLRAVLCATPTNK